MTTSAADPDDLQTFVTDAAAARTELSGAASSVQSLYDSVLSGIGSQYTLSHPDLWAKLSTHLTDAQERERFVDSVRGAFVAADRGSSGTAAGIVTTSDTTIAAALIKAGVGALPATELTVDAPEIRGRPLDSGFAEDPVCTANGNLVESELDLPMPGRAAVLGWQRTYNSRALADRGALGLGWSCWADAALDLTADVVRWRSPDGAQSVVRRPTAGHPSPMPLLGAILHTVAAAPSGLAGGSSNGIAPAAEPELEPEAEPGQPTAPTRGPTAYAAAAGGFRFVRDAGQASEESWWYDPAGRPVRIESGPRACVLDWENKRLVRMSEPRSGRYLTLDWDTSRELVVGVRTSDGRSVHYRYDDAANLIEASGGPGGPRTYRAQAGLLLGIVDADGVELVQTHYDEAGRVISQRSPEGRLTRFSYSGGYRTIVRDESGGAINGYQHDQAGRLTAVIDDADHAMHRSFDAAGRLVGVRERSGARWSLGYDSAGNLIRRTGPEDFEEAFTWDAAGRLLVHTDAGGHETRWTYAAALRTPTEIVDPAGGVTRLTVNADDLPTCIVDPDGVACHLRWDDDGQPIRIWTRGGGQTTFRYDRAGRLVGMTGPDGQARDWETDAAGRVILERFAGLTRQFGHTPAGRPETYVDAAGGRWRSTHGPSGRVSEVADPLGSTVRFDYDRFGNTSQVVAPDGNAFSFAYDGLSRLVAVTDPAGATLRRGYDADGRQTTGISAAGAGWRHEHDGRGRLVAIIGPDGQIWQRAYDRVGRLISQTDPTGARTQHDHDPAGRPVRITDPAGNQTTYVWTPGGRQAAVTTPSGRTITYGYDRAGRLAETRLPSGATERYQWDMAGRLSALIRPDGRTMRWEYDRLGAVSAITGPSGGRVVAENTPLGLPARLTLAGGATYRYRYDARGALTEITDPLGAVSSYHYDQRGRLASWTDPLGGTTRFGYDAVGRLATRSDPLGRTTITSRDADGLTRTVQHPDGSGTHTWRDRAGRITGRGPLAADTPRITHGYDPAGRLLSAREDGGRDVQLRYDPAGRLARRTTAAGTIVWDHDPDGRITAVGVPGAPSLRYHHDADGDLDAVLDPDRGRLRVPSRSAATQAGERDADGRIVRTTVAGQPVHFGYDAAGQLVQADGPWGHHRYRWDLGGRLIAEERSRAGDTATARSRQARYDAAGQLTETLDTADGGTPIRTVYGYDAAGRRRTERRSDGRTVTYDWDDLGRLDAVHRTGASPTRLVTDASGAPIAVGDTPVLWDSLAGPGHTRRLGDRWVTPETQAPGAQGPHDPWGEATPAADPATERSATIGFRGELAVNGLVWQRERVLDPATRSFLSVDPLVHVPGLPGAANPYQYAWNNPVGLLDPTGQRPLTDSQYQDYLSQQRAGLFEKAWTNIREDPWGSLAAVGVVAAGVGLCFVPGGQAIGAGILIGAATSGGIGLVTGHFDPRAVAIGGIAGAVGGGVGQATSRLLATGPSYLVAAEAGAAAGSAEDLAAQQLAHPGHINLTELAISSGTGGLAGAGGRAFARRAPLTQGAPETSHALPPATGGIDSLPAPPRPVFAGHGQIRPGDASTVTIPEGTSLTMYIRHGMPITDDLGYAIETNDVATMKIFEWLGPNSYEKFTYPAGSSIPDYSLIPGSDLHIAPTSRTVNRPTRLSELLEPNMGDWHWAACRVVQGW
ncbi:DUF6531 domain-containing protein [Frankia sp. Ag45/Mut15]|uniref:DUF6531 domain-containing protein n=1 Tax=Frankia umida TaxID=573489 RepID=A0ABT0JVD5_9ACTN|nr:DUF6531 domain-containing protein [Frankia umida]MCK9875497.1 DUF6531 domain-containing protein [Frankia umida]